MKNVVAYMLILMVCFSSCKKEANPVVQPVVDPNVYLEKWTGEYEGISRYWTSYPKDTFIYHYERFSSIEVDVVKGSIDSTLSVYVFFKNGTSIEWTDLVFNVEGKHFSHNGAQPSVYESIKIEFANDSMFYEHFKKCGMPCGEGRDFHIARK